MYSGFGRGGSGAYLSKIVGGPMEIRVLKRGKRSPRPALDRVGTVWNVSGPAGRRCFDPNLPGRTQPDRLGVMFSSIQGETGSRGLVRVWCPNHRPLDQTAETISGPFAKA